MLACLLYGVLLVIVIAFMCCMMPWWMVLLIVGGGFIYNFVIRKDGLFHPTEQYKPKKKRKRSKNKGKANSINHKNGTVLRGTTAYRTPNTSTDYDHYIAAKREERAAYDDFIASTDMADD